MEPNDEEPPICPWCNKPTKATGELCDLCNESFNEQSDWDLLNSENDE